MYIFTFLFIKFHSFSVTVRSSSSELSSSINKRSIHSEGEQVPRRGTAEAVLANTARHYRAFSRCSQKYVPLGTGGELENHSFLSNGFMRFL